MATAPVVKDLSAAVMLTIESESRAGARHDAGLHRLHKDLGSRGRRDLRTEGFSLDSLAVQTFLDMRYAGQSYELSVPVESLAPRDILPRFHAAHHERYGHSDGGRAVEIVTLRVKLVLGGVAMGNEKRDARKARATEARTPHRSSRREVWFDRKATRAAVYERAALSRGDTFRGPAIVVQMDSTTAVPPRWHLQVDAARNLILERI
jgi:N-methylhydantoinase A